MMSKPIATDPKLLALIEESKRRVAAMTPVERDAMYAAQREGYARAEAIWPKARFHYDPLTGAKVYESYEDYAND